MSTINNDTLKNNYTKQGIIVIGGHVQGLGITRIYGKQKIPVVLLDDTKVNLTRHSKYCTKFLYYKKDKLLRHLRRLAELKQYKNWLIIPTNDAHVEILSMHKSELSLFFNVSTDYYDVLKHFFNKKLSYKLAEELNIPFPKTWMPNHIDDLNLLDIKYPCIIKPAIMYTFYSQTKKKVFVCNNFDELKENYLRALRIIPENEIIVQDIIPGGSEHQYSACFMFNGKESLVSLTARRERQHPPDFGNATTYAVTVSNDVIMNYAIRLLKKVNYTGVCEVEFKLDQRDNVYKFLEVNPRTWKWHSISEKTGSPFLMSLFNFLTNNAPIINNNPKSASFRHLITDIPTMIRMRFNGNKLNKTKRENLKYAVWDLDDLLPALFELAYLPYLIFKR